jgi:hypothetical protein
VNQVCSNRIGDDGAEFLSDMIKGHSSILELRADSNLIGNLLSHEESFILLLLIV